MKFKQLIFASLMLQVTSTLDASDLLTRINATTLSLLNAQTTLANIMTPPTKTVVADVAPTSIAAPAYIAAVQNTPTVTYTPHVVQTITMITNKSTQPVYLAMFDQNSKQINPTIILLNINDSSYILANASTIQIVDNNNKQLIGTTPVMANSLYTLTNTANKWNLVSTSASQNSATFKYKNSTAVPFIIAITAGNIINSQQLAPGEEYTQTIDPTTLVTVKAHANLSSIKYAYNSAASYNLTVNNGNLTLTQTSTSGNTLTNSCGWPMLISFTLPGNKKDTTILEDGHRYQPGATSTNIMAIPVIPNSTSKAALVESCTIANNSGQINLQFA